MIKDLIDIDIQNNLGNKAKYLSILKKNNFNIPNGFVLDTTSFDEIIAINKIENDICKILSEINENNITNKSKELQTIIDNIKIPNEILNEINKRCDKNKKYAVRSSGTKEDLENFSFAGQYDTFLNIIGTSEEISKSILKCYKSMYSEVILSYLINNNLQLKDLKMSVIVQEMVDSEISGIAFTVNPKTGVDKEIIVEVAQGLGENIVSGKVKPENYTYNWYENKFKYDVNNKLLTKNMLEVLMNELLKIQEFFGFPCDIEFAFYKSELYILQARAITKIHYAGIKDIWSTADFKDGRSFCNSVYTIYVELI